MTGPAPSPTVGVLNESRPGERRVALVPADVRRLTALTAILVETGAGEGAGFANADYVAAGAVIVDRPALFAAADLALAVQVPTDISRLRPGSALVSLGGRDDGVAESLRGHGIQHLGLERLPRTTRAQGMDVLSSQASIAGYAAVIEGARALDVLLPNMTTAAGSLKPARMIALGAGVAGLQAIATARRLGALAHGFDVRDAAREQVESLGAKFISLGDAKKAHEAESGYAADQSADDQASLRQALRPVLLDMQLIITSAQIPGRPAPLMIDDETLAALPRGTVIVDLAAETGGNTSRTEPGDRVDLDGVTILGAVNLPSLMALDASRLWSGNMRALLEHLLAGGSGLQLRLDDPITAALLGADLVLAAA
jgi:NAD(P) transhydrogenase subunit alpha